MSYTALYRKWRPQNFDDVKGQDHIIQTLKNQIISNRMGHAYLFCGTRGTGKTSVAKILAKAVNCEQPEEFGPCGTCNICKSIAKASSLNVVEIDAASNNGVENIREIREQVQYPPTEGRYRVYIIDEVHMLSTGAFNALLKTLEEPPSYVIFILATTEVHKIPVTVLSRCQRYDFKRITVETITMRLIELTKEEGIEAEEKALQYIAKAADGALRDALSLLDQCVAFHFGSLLTYEHVLETLGAVDTSIFSNLLNAIWKHDVKQCICRLEDIVLQGRDLGQFTTDFIWYLRNLLLLKTASGVDGMIDLSEENLQTLKEEATKVDGETLVRYIRVFSELSNQLRYATQKRILIEVALIKLTKPQMEQNLDSILHRLGQLEEQIQNGVSIAGLQHDKTKELPQEVDDGKKQVVLPKAQLEDLNTIRERWSQIVREQGGVIRSSFKDTIIEPAGEGMLCIVFQDMANHSIGSRPQTLSLLEDSIRQRYQKEIAFKTRLKENRERLDTIYVSEEDLKANIHMEIIIEDE